MHPTSIVAQQEIFGPVLAAMTFRTPSEAVELANNTVYGLAACVWSESINVALQVASQLKAGVTWVNCTNLFDASCGFGGYRESGFGREGGKEGLMEYLEPVWFKSAPSLPAAKAAPAEHPEEDEDSANPPIDRTVKLYIGGKQARPDSGYSIEVRGRNGQLLGEAPYGNRKDIRNAVEAARKASGWAKAQPTTARRFCITWRKICRSGEKRLRAGCRRRLAKLKPKTRSARVSREYFRMGRGRTSLKVQCTPPISQRDARDE